MRPHLVPATAVLLCAVACAYASDPPPKILHTDAGTVETGRLHDVPYRIDVPENWNHALVVFYHGYSEHLYGYRAEDKLSFQVRPFVDRHYAVIQSAYSQTGWALPQAYPETEELRRYFLDHYAEHQPPLETYAAGASMGGALVAVTLELNPQPYLGGLDLCGAVGPTSESFERRFAMRAAFDVYFPHLLGPLVPVPPDFDDTEPVRAKVLEALKANPTAAANMRALTALRSDADLANEIVYFTFVVGDMQRRAGANPFDNRNWLYTGADTISTTADAELNAKVHRYTADPHAAEYLYQHYSPTGRLGRPMLAVHTLYDPKVPAAGLVLYSHIVERAGFSANLVQQYVTHDGHCAISSDEIGTAFDELVRWTHKGPRPAPGLLKTPPKEPAN